jgi:hypothetical protein
MDLSTPKVNIDSKEHAFAHLLKNTLTPGQRMHVVVVGNHVRNDVTFVGLLWPKNEDDLDLSGNGPSLNLKVNGLMVDLRACKGVILRFANQDVDLPWGDIIELWPLPQD